MRIEILVNGEVENVIIATEEFAEEHYHGAWRAASEQDPPFVPVVYRRISVGAFFDRFGAEKWAILGDANASVQAVIKDASVREYIDLDRPDLPAGLAILESAGYDIDVNAILHGEINDSELPKIAA